MKLVSSAAILISLGGWVLLLLTFVNMLSGSLETRECSSECVQGYYFGATALGVIGVLAAFAALFSDSSRRLGFFSLILALPLVGIAVGIFLIGNFGHLIH